MNRLERVIIALPGGDLERSVLNRINESGLEVAAVDRRYLIPVRKIPVDLLIDRASGIPDLVTDKESEVKAGITGSDILWEAGMGKNAGDVLPIQSNSTVVLAAARALREETKRLYGRKPTRADFAGGIVFTKFPNIARDIFEEGDIEDVEIRYAPGKTEAKQYAYVRNRGILDVRGSGATMRRNGMTIVRKVLSPVTIRLVKADERLSDRDQQIIADFCNRLKATKKQ